MNTFPEHSTAAERPPYTDPGEYFDYLSTAARESLGLKKESALLYAASVAVNMDVPTDEKLQQINRVEAEIGISNNLNRAVGMAFRIGSMLVEPQIGRLELYTNGTIVTDREGIDEQHALSLSFLGLVVRGEKPHIPGELPWQWLYPTCVNDVVVVQTEHIQGGHFAYKPIDLEEYAAKGEEAPSKVFTRIIAARPGYITGRVGG